MWSQNKTRISLLVAGLALLAASCGEEEDVSPTYEDRIPLGVELKTAGNQLVWGEETRLRGVLSQGDEKLGSEEVVLEADPYPFDRDYGEIASVTTGAAGQFEFEVAPDADTAYRAVAGELSQAPSDPVRIQVAPRLRLKSEPARGGTRFTTIFRHPEDRSIQGSTVFSYASPAAESPRRLRFVGTQRVEQDKQGRSRASTTLPYAPGEVVYATCESYAGGSGMSGPRRLCPQSSLRAPR